jgi:hypothetical protein
VTQKPRLQQLIARKGGFGAVTITLDGGDRFEDILAAARADPS